MKTNSIIYKSFVPTVLKPQKEIKSEPTFKYKGYQRQYRWDRDNTSQDTSQTQSEVSEETTSTQPESNQTVASIQSSSITPGTTTYKDPTINVGNMKDLLDRFNQAGISVRVTSGLRPGATTSNGSKSWHSEGWAIDITPGDGETWESLRTKLKSSPDLIKYMQDNQLGILDETNPDMLARTGGTGAHWHIGPDKVAISGLKTILKGRKGLKIPILFAKEGTKSKSVVQRLLDTPLKSVVIGNQFQDLDPKILKQYVNIATDFIPVVGDAKELYNIGENIKNKQYIPATISALSFLLPGNVTGGTRKLLGFNYPYFDLEYTTKSGNLIKNKGIDKEIKNTESLLAKRYATKGNRILELPQELNGEQVSDIIQNWEPQIREVVTSNGTRASGQIGWYKHDNISNQPLDLSIGDKNLITKELNTRYTSPNENYKISDASRRQMLDHEISHWLDYTFRPEIQNSQIDFLTTGTEDLVKNPSEIIARTGQVKSYNNISNGSQTFTGEQYKQMFENYINDKNNPDNFISVLKSRIKDWDKFAKWANENIPLAAKPLKPFLWNPNNSEEDD